MNALETLDLVGVAESIARGELSAHDATAWSLQRLQTTGRKLNAVFRIDMALVNAMAQLVMAVEAATLQRRWIESRPQGYADQVRLSGES